uniref:Uncharacterized protein n=1 Tax=Anopheles albimanus TaxID=7167 RepID=A0A182FXZ4_ANOAL
MSCLHLWTWPTHLLGHGTIVAVVLLLQTIITVCVLIPLALNLGDAELLSMEHALIIIVTLDLLFSICYCIGFMKRNRQFLMAFASYACVLCLILIAVQIYNYKYYDVVSVQWMVTVVLIGYMVLVAFKLIETIETNDSGKGENAVNLDGLEVVSATLNHANSSTVTEATPKDNQTIVKHGINV